MKPFVAPAVQALDLLEEMSGTPRGRGCERIPFSSLRRAGWPIMAGKIDHLTFETRTLRFDYQPPARELALPAHFETTRPDQVVLQAFAPSPERPARPTGGNWRFSRHRRPPHPITARVRRRSPRRDGRSSLIAAQRRPRSFGNIDERAASRNPVRAMPVHVRVAAPGSRRQALIASPKTRSDQATIAIGVVRGPHRSWRRPFEPGARCGPRRPVMSTRRSRHWTSHGGQTSEDPNRVALELRRAATGVGRFATRYGRAATGRRLEMIGNRSWVTSENRLFGRDVDRKSTSLSGPGHRRGRPSRTRTRCSTPRRLELRRVLTRTDRHRPAGELGRLSLLARQQLLDGVRPPAVAG